VILLYGNLKSEESIGFTHGRNISLLLKNTNKLSVECGGIEKIVDFKECGLISIK
jgi:hypothetical protein